jgi:hypothetical protein
VARDRRLLIISCSERKSSESGMLPALDRYDGPAFWVLRRFLREQPDRSKALDVFVLSAAFGIIPASRPIPDYDQIMTRQRARELHDGVLADFANLISDNYSALCLAMSDRYLTTLEGWSELITPGISTTITDGPQGAKLAQLKQWLWQDRADDTQQTCKIKRSGVAHLRGIELRMAPTEVLERTGAALAQEKQTEAKRFRKWYIRVDGQRVAVKWAVSRLTDLPVSDFTTGEARRVLAQLGIQPRSVTEGEGNHEIRGN